MSEIESKDIAAIKIDDELVCKNCVTNDDEYTEEDVLLYDDLEKDITYFCDRCKKNIFI